VYRGYPLAASAATARVVRLARLTSIQIKAPVTVLQSYSPLTTYQLDVTITGRHHVADSVTGCIGCGKSVKEAITFCIRNRDH
jgi:hypothetical protein